MCLYVVKLTLSSVVNPKYLSFARVMLTYKLTFYFFNQISHQTHEEKAHMRMQHCALSTGGQQTLWCVVLTENVVQHLLYYNPVYFISVVIIFL